MLLLRFLAALVGGTLHRLGHALRSWAGAAQAESGNGGVKRAPDDGPPEQWLRYVRERAPWLVVGKISDLRRSAPRRAPVTAAAVRAAAAQAPTAASARTSAPAPAHTATSAASALAAAAPAPVPAATSATSALAAAAAPAPIPGAAPAQTRPTQHPAPVIRDEGQARLIWERPRLDAREIEKLPELSSRPSLATPVQSSVAPPSVELPIRAASETPRSHESIATPALDSWPSLPAAAFGVDGGEEGPRSPSTRGEESEAPPTLFERRPEDDVASAATPPVQVEADEAGYWADLPDKGFETWQIQATRSLLREQAHLARLMAEQAGFSWSTPHS